MRAKVPKNRKAVSRPVSLFPRHLAHMRRKANAVGVSQSRYLQDLIEHDIANNLLVSSLSKQEVGGVE